MLLPIFVELPLTFGHMEQVAPLTINNIHFILVVLCYQCSYY